VERVECDGDWKDVVSERSGRKLMAFGIMLLEKERTECDGV